MFMGNKDESFFIIDGINAFIAEMKKLEQAGSLDHESCEDCNNCNQCNATGYCHTENNRAKNTDFKRDSYEFKWIHDVRPKNAIDQTEDLLNKVKKALEIDSNNYNLQNTKELRELLLKYIVIFIASDNEYNALNYNRIIKALQISIPLSQSSSDKFLESLQEYAYELVIASR